MGVENGKSPPPDAPHGKLSLVQPDQSPGLVLVTEDSKIAIVELAALPEKFRTQAVMAIEDREIGELKPETSLHMAIFRFASNAEKAQERLLGLSNLLNRAKLDTEDTESSRATKAALGIRQDTVATSVESAIKFWREDKVKIISDYFTLMCADLPVIFTIWRPNIIGDNQVEGNNSKRTEGGVEHAKTRVKDLRAERIHGPLAQVLGPELMAKLGAEVSSRVMPNATPDTASEAIAPYQGKVIDLIKIFQEALAQIAINDVEDTAMIDKFKRENVLISTLAAACRLDESKVAEIETKLTERMESMQTLAGDLNEPGMLNTLDPASTEDAQTLMDDGQKEKFKTDVVEMRGKVSRHTAVLMENLAEIKAKRFLYLTKDLPRLIATSRHESEPAIEEIKGLQNSTYGDSKWVVDNLIQAANAIAAQSLFEALKKFAQCDFMVEKRKSTGPQEPQEIADLQLCRFFKICKNLEVIATIFGLIENDGLEKWPESVENASSYAKNKEVKAKANIFYEANSP